MKLLDDFLQSRWARELGVHVGPIVEKHYGVIPSDGARFRP